MQDVFAQGKVFHKKGNSGDFSLCLKNQVKGFFRQENKKMSTVVHLRFFSSFLSFFFAPWLPAAACFESSSAFAFFAWFSFTICFLLVGIQSPLLRFWLIVVSFFPS